MRTRRLAIALTAILFASAQFSFAQVVINEKTNPGAQGGLVIPAGGFGWGGGGPNFEMFMMTLTQLNMTPDLTLDKETKQKLADVRTEWQKHQAEFMQAHRDDFQKAGKEQMEAYQSRDQEKIKEATKKMQDLYASGPKAEDYINKAKAVMPAEQAKLVEEKIARAEADRKAMMEKWKAREQPGGEANPKPGQRGEF